MSSIDEIKSRIDIVDLVSDSVKLRRSGKNYTGFCPFHSNTRTPAFVIFPETGTWRCFGECNEGGDIFKFLMKKEGWDFPEALRHLADRAGVVLRKPTQADREQEEIHGNLRSLLDDAVTFYRHNLVNTPAGKEVMRYLTGHRQLTPETIETFGIGYAPESWDIALNHFKSRGYSEADLIAAGMVSERDQGGVYDRFRNRIMLPIRDGRGRMAGFGARIVNPDDVPKFLNSPQTPVFDKSKLLYGLDRARKTIRMEDRVVIVEGYMDVIAPHQHGYQNVVSPMGTALTDPQFRAIKRFTRNIVLAMDPDAAGDKAIFRGLEIARETMDRSDEIRFDARGLLRHEARLQADIRVTTMPDGLDPDEVVNKDSKLWEDLIANAKPIVMHVMHTLAGEKDVDDPKVKTEIASQVMPLIEDIPSSIERDTYRQQLARLLHVDERTLIGSTRRKPSRKPKRRTAQQGQEINLQPTIPTSDSREIHCVGVLMRRPELIYHVDRKLREEGLERLTVDDFQVDDHKAIFKLVQRSLLQEDSDPLEFVLNNLAMEKENIADGILEQTQKVDPENDEVLNDLLRALLILRQRNLRQNNEYLRFVIEETKDDEIIVQNCHKTIVNNAVLLQRLDKAMNRYTYRSFSSQ